MKQTCGIFVVIVTLAFSNSTTAKTAATKHPCPETSWQELQTQLKDSGPTTIVFFASWCSSCLPHLRAKSATTEQTIFVAAFDESERAAKVAATFDLRGKCFTSKDIAEQLRVRSLPATRTMRF